MEATTETQSSLPFSKIPKRKMTLTTCHPQYLLECGRASLERLLLIQTGARSRASGDAEGGTGPLANRS